MHNYICTRICRVMVGFVFVGLVSSGSVCFEVRSGQLGPRLVIFFSTSTETFKYGPSCLARVTIAEFDIWCWSTSLLFVCLCACLSYRLLVYKALVICIRLFWSSHHKAEIMVICIYFLLAEALLVQTVACNVSVPQHCCFHSHSVVLGRHYFKGSK